MDDDIQRSEIFCHECGQYVQFNLNLSINGQHTVVCPRCGHEHYRYIENGRISDRRWASSGGIVILVSSTSMTTSAVPMVNSTSTGNNVQWISGTWSVGSNSTTGGW